METVAASYLTLMNGLDVRRVVRNSVLDAVHVEFGVPQVRLPLALLRRALLVTRRRLRYHSLLLRHLDQVGCVHGCKVLMTHFVLKLLLIQK